MKNLNNNKLVNRFNKFALEFVKLAAFFLISFLVEQTVKHFLGGVDSAILEFALNELGNALVVKSVVRLLLALNLMRVEEKDAKK